MLVETWQIERVRAYEKNARVIPQRAIDKVALSLKTYGWRQPIVVDKHGVIVCGHTRLLAAKKLGYTEVPVHVALDLTAAQIRAYRLADNRTAMETSFDDDLLKLELMDLKELDFDLAMTGFELPEIEKLLKPSDADDERANETPELPEHPVSRTGDLWVLGNHRLLCGDSTNAGDVELVMNGERAGLLNTDPPYGVSYANDERPNPGVAKPRVANDGLQNEALQAFLESAFRAAKEHGLSQNAAWYLWHAHLTQGFFAAAAAAAAAAVKLHRQIIWVKPVLLLGRGHYHWKHEPCFMGWVEGHQPPDYGRGMGERDQTTVWEVAGVTQAERKQFNHSTPKPVELFRIPIVKHLKHGEVCFEPFAGSGPQVIAAEQTGRRCFAIEKDARYVDVIVQRWQTFTGRTAGLAEDGRTFDQVAEDRHAETQAAA